MNSRISFAQFDAVLEELGFRKEVVKGSHVNYWHDNWKSPFMVRLHKPKEFVPNYVLAGTRIQMEHLGLIAAAEFDELLQAAAA